MKINPNIDINITSKIDVDINIHNITRKHKQFNINIQPNLFHLSLLVSSHCSYSIVQWETLEVAVLRVVGVEAYEDIILLKCYDKIFL